MLPEKQPEPELESEPIDQVELEGPEVLGSHVCDTCMGDNLLKESGIRQCSRCMNPFCLHFASKADPLMYCVSCMSELTLQRSVVTKKYEHYNEQTDVTTSYSRRAKEIHLEGEDWLFAQRRIKDLSDPELDMIIEYHRQYLHLLCADQERRKMEKMHRNAGIRFIMPGPIGATSTTVVTTTKRTTTTKIDKNKEKAAAILAQLLKSGVSLEALQAIGKKSGS